MRMLTSLLLVFACGLSAAEVVDKVAIVVERTAITDRQIRQEILHSSFLNGQQPQFNAEARKQAASRLIDQELIHREMRNGGYPEAIPEQALQLFGQLKGRYSGDAAFRQTLMEQGIDEQELMRRLEWQAAVLSFVSKRFSATVTTPSSGPDDINESFFGWLDTTRKDTRIEYRSEDLK